MNYRAVLILAAVFIIAGCSNAFRSSKEIVEKTENYSEKGVISGELMQGWQKIPSSKSRIAIRRRKTSGTASQPSVGSQQSAAAKSSAASARAALPAQHSTENSTSSSAASISAPVPAAVEPVAVSSSSPEHPLPQDAQSAAMPALPEDPRELASILPDAQEAASSMPAAASASISSPRPAQQPAGTRTASSFLVQKAGQELQAGNLDAAAAYLENALSINPRNASIRFDIANIRYHQGRYREAEQQAALAIQTSGRGNLAITRKSWELIANARKNLGDNQGAIRAAEQAASAREAQYNY